MNYKITIETTDKDFVEGIQDIAEEYVEDLEERYNGNHNFSFMIKSYIGEDLEDCEECECIEEEFDNFTFGDALNFIIRKPNFGMRLLYWDEDEVVRVQNPDEHSKMSYPYLYMETPCENFPYIPCYEDMFSDDWEVVKMKD